MSGALKGKLIVYGQWIGKIKTSMESLGLCTLDLTCLNTKYRIITKKIPLQGAKKANLFEYVQTRGPLDNNEPIN